MSSDDIAEVTNILQGRWKCSDEVNFLQSCSTLQGSPDFVRKLCYRKIVNLQDSKITKSDKLQNANALFQNSGMAHSTIDREE